MSEISEIEIKSMTKEQNYMRGYEDGKSDVLDKLKRITDLMNDLDLKMIHTELWHEKTRTELWQEIKGLSIDDIEELMWDWYSFIIDVYDTLNVEKGARNDNN